ncbi:MAG: hypothetical protein NTX57_07985 [Armatimonadetes bacterium]|nr:hypothetical protein [Armatimonadota bacterium]
MRIPHTLKPSLALTLLLGLATQPISGCFSGCNPAPSAPPPAPPVMSAPAGRSGMPDLPPDPRALKNGGPKSAPTSSGAVGTTTLPAKPVPGSALNKFFPNDADGYDRIFTQEKNGFAMANLNKGGKTVATLSINDCAALPSSRDKFKSAGRSVAGNPATNDGMSGIAMLVGDRYQVKIRATGGALSDADMQAWLEKFDLSGLAGLK